ncbi:MAG: Ig-like domain-containing protein, partial [Marmoricola sp.]
VVVTIAPGSETQGDAVQTLSAPVSPDGSWSVTAGALTDGSYTLQATQSDAAGNTGVSSPVSFTVSTAPADTTAPSVAVTTPSAGATVVTAGVPVAGTAGTDAGDNATVSLEVYTGASAAGTPTQTLTTGVSSGAWSSNVTGLAAGTYTLVAVQGDAAGNVGRSQPVTFTKAVVPTITTITPATLGQGATSATVRVDGSGFNSSTAVAISGAGVTSSVVTRTGTAVTLNVTVDAAAPIQLRDVTVTNSTGATATCTGCLSIVAGPKISAVSPSTARRGQSTTVTITGSGFPTGNGNVLVAVSGTGITVGTIRRDSATSATAVLQVSSTAPLTARSLTLTNKSTLGSATMPNAFTVVP